REQSLGDLRVVSGTAGRRVEERLPKRHRVGVGISGVLVKPGRFLIFFAPQQLIPRSEICCGAPAQQQQIQATKTGPHGLLLVLGLILSRWRLPPRAAPPRSGCPAGPRSPPKWNRHGLTQCRDRSPVPNPPRPT